MALGVGTLSPPAVQPLHLKQNTWHLIPPPLFDLIPDSMEPDRLTPKNTTLTSKEVSVSYNFSDFQLKFFTLKTYSDCPRNAYMDIPPHLKPL